MPKKSILDNNNLPILYCRKCQQIKKEADFYSATDILLDKNGFQSVCKSCIQELYEGFYQSENSLDRAIYLLCKTLNVIYIQSSVDAVKTYIENKTDDNKPINNVFGLYKRMLSPHAKGIQTDGPENLTFQEISIPIVENNFSIGTDEKNKELIKFWGDGFQSSDYEFLEDNYTKWVASHKSDTMAEITLLKEIVYKQLEIQKDRLGGRSTAAGVKQLQEIMKTASVDPSKANIAGAGKSQDTFSSFIKTIEENEPASFYEDKELFDDFKDQKDLDFYFQKYVLRPLKNFVTQSRDFSVEVDDNNDEDDIDLVQLGTDDDIKSDDETKLGE